VNDDKLAVLRWRRGQQAAERRQREVRAERGPRPELAVAEAMAALNAAAAIGLWPAPRSASSLRAVDEVRRRWALVENRARKNQGG
jgi:hypothetical protein